MERFDGKKMRYAVNIPGFVVRDILTNVCGVGSTHVGRMLRVCLGIDSICSLRLPSTFGGAGGPWGPTGASV